MSLPVKNVLQSPKIKKSSSFIKGNIFAMNFANDKAIEDFFQKEDSDDDENDNEKSFLSMPAINNEKFRNPLQDDEEGTGSDNAKNDNLVIKDEIEDGNRRSLFQRVLGPVDAGSVRGSIFNLTIFCLGSGVLNIPQRIGQMSLLVCIIDIFLSAFATYLTLNLLIISSKRIKNYNYGDVVEDYFGKVAGFILNFACLTYNFGILMLYMVISKFKFNFFYFLIFLNFILAYKLIGAVINDVGGYGYKDMNAFCNESFWNDYVWKFSVMYGIVIFILLPLSLMRDISKLRMFSIFAVLSLFIMMFIIIFQTPSYYNYWQSQKKEGEDVYNFFDISTGFTPDLFFFKGTATIFYAFACHVGALPVMKSLKNNYSRRIQKVIKRSVVMDIVCYLLIGICGYISCPKNTPDLIIERPKIGETDYFMTIGRILFLLTLIFKMPTSYISLRISALSILNIKEDKMSPLV